MGWKLGVELVSRGPTEGTRSGKKNGLDVVLAGWVGWACGGERGKFVRGAWGALP